MILIKSLSLLDYLQFTVVPNGAKLKLQRLIEISKNSLQDTILERFKIWGQDVFFVNVRVAINDIYYVWLKLNLLAEKLLDLMQASHLKQILLTSLEQIIRPFCIFSIFCFSCYWSPDFIYLFPIVYRKQTASYVAFEKAFAWKILNNCTLLWTICYI